MGGRKVLAKLPQVQPAPSLHPHAHCGEQGHVFAAGFFGLGVSSQTVNGTCGGVGIGSGFLAEW